MTIGYNGYSSYSVFANRELMDSEILAKQLRNLADPEFQGAYQWRILRARKS
jgi:hypothetical protein